MENDILHATSTTESRRFKYRKIPNTGYQNTEKYQVESTKYRSEHRRNDVLTPRTPKYRPKHTFWCEKQWFWRRNLRFLKHLTESCASAVKSSVWAYVFPCFAPRPLKMGFLFERSSKIRNYRRSLWITALPVARECLFEIEKFMRGKPDEPFDARWPDFESKDTVRVHQFGKHR